MFDHKPELGDVFNTRVRSGWEKWTLTLMSPDGSDTMLGFDGRNDDGTRDPNRKAIMYFLSAFDYKKGEYFEKPTDARGNYIY